MAEQSSEMGEEMTYPTQEELEAMCDPATPDLNEQRMRFARRIIDWHTAKLAEQEPVAVVIDAAEGYDGFNAIVDSGDALLKPLQKLYARPMPAAPAVPAISAIFETEDQHMIGTRSATVKRVEHNDDGSITVVIDHWPALPQPPKE